MGSPDNPPAFANDAADCNAYEGQLGMTLRDWFAGQAVPAVLKIVNSVPLPSKMPNKALCKFAAKIAYEMADAMLAERIKEPEA